MGYIHETRSSSFGCPEVLGAKFASIFTVGKERNVASICRHAELIKGNIRLKISIKVRVWCLK